MTAIRPLEAASSAALGRPAGGVVDLTDRAEMIGEVGNASDNAIQLDAADLARRAHRLEPAMRFVAKIGPELPPLAVGD